MIINYSKCAGRYPLQRLIFTGTIATVVVTILLYIAITHPHKRPVKDVQMSSINVDVKYIITELNLNDDSQLYYESGEEYPEYSPAEMEDMDKIMDSRRNYVKEICHLLQINQTGDINAYAFLSNEKYHLLWCDALKDIDLVGHKKHDNEAPTVDEVRAMEKNATSVLIVRHPFERLISVYKEKMQNYFPMDEYSDLGDSIILNYRRDYDGVNKSLVYPPWPTFDEFVSYIIDEFNLNRTLDSHWAPYSAACTPCHFDFDIIVKYETLEDDRKYFIQKAGLRDVIKLRTKSPSDYQLVEDVSNNTETMESLFSQLTSDQITFLYEIYRYDFLLFDYNTQEYYDVSKDGTNFYEISTSRTSEELPN